MILLLRHGLKELFDLHVRVPILKHGSVRPHAFAPSPHIALISLCFCNPKPIKYRITSDFGLFTNNSRLISSNCGFQYGG